MKILNIALTGIALVGLTACSSGNVVSRAMTSPNALLSEGYTLQTPSYNITAVNVTVPPELIATEDNGYKPNADIVWHGDPYGDRRAQVAAIFKDAMRQGVSGIRGQRKVIMSIEVARFHALTPRARYTVGGNHDIHFVIRILDATTGVELEPARMVETDLNALGGVEALAAERQGLTQKVRITAHLAQLIQTEMASARPVPS
ncbi:MAG TPA: hypothetical protein EYP10_08155 [Armatimonadetes bacterium]|nr:hypothetical protein [Armatimonadota bacterium]